MHVYQRSDAGRIHVRHVGEIDDDVGRSLRTPHLLKIKQVIQHQRTSQTQYDFANARAIQHFNGKGAIMHDESSEELRDYTERRRFLKQFWANAGATAN